MVNSDEFYLLTFKSGLIASRCYKIKFTDVPERSHCSAKRMRDKYNQGLADGKTGNSLILDLAVQGVPVTENDKRALYAYVVASLLCYCEVVDVVQIWYERIFVSSYMENCEMLLILQQ